MTFHLSHEQLCDLLLEQVPATDTAPAQQHLRDCAQCTSALDSLRQPLTLFGEAATTLAGHEYTALPPAVITTLSAGAAITLNRRPLAWAVAAVLLCASALPFALSRKELHRRPASAPASIAAPTAQPAPELSDEALLDQVDQALDASIPAPMRPLADPTLNQRTPSTAPTERTN